MRLSAFAAVICCLIFTGSAAAATPAGKAVGVNPSAQDVVANSTRTLVVGSDVAMGDKIVTGANGQVQLVFNDQTHLVVGPSSALVIESYLLRNDKSVSQFTLDALGGSYRFITGQSDHSVYTIKTPTGTIGVRGTAFDWTTAKPGTTGQARSAASTPGTFLPGTVVALFRGAVILCDLQKKCVTLNSKCDAGMIETDKAQTIGRFDAADMQLRSRFIYIQSQKPLLEPFQINEARLCFIQPGGSNSGLSITMSSPTATSTPSRCGFDC